MAAAAPAAGWTKSALVLAVLAVGAFVWLGKASDDWSHAYSFRGQQGDYYNLLVDGFQAGHTHLNLPVHPDRLSEDPVVRERAPRALDAGLYNGRYYLYYGVGPAVLMLWPYSSLTGHDLSLNIPTLGFTLIGFWLSLAWYRRAKAAWFPRTGALIDASAVVLLAFAVGTTFLVRRSMFYELPLSLGYAALAGFILAITAALQEQARALRWLCGASIAAGIAASAHPNLALLTLPLAAIGWWIWRETPADRRRLRAIAATTVLPAAAIGGALAAYNYARFGSLTEFGFTYGENVFFTTGERLIGLDFLWPNFRWYYLTPPSFLPYFPFTFPLNGSFRPPGYHGIEAVHGEFAFTLFVLWLVGSYVVFRPRLWVEPALRRLLLVVAAAGLISAACLMSFGIRANRYLVDFQLPAVVLAVLAAALLADRARAGRTWRITTFAGAVFVAAINVLCAIQQFDQFRHTRPREVAQLSTWLNPSWATWEKLGLTRPGWPELTVRFAPQEHAVIEPLLSTGVPLYTDALYVAQHPNGYLEFMADHHGYGGPRSGLIPYQVGRPYRITIQMGSLLPPLGDPANARFDRTAFRAHKQRVRVLLDGQTVLDGPMRAFEAAPWDRQFGANRKTHNAYASTFSGFIDQVEWKPYDFPPVSIGPQGVVRLAFELAPGVRGPQPLMASGKAGAGSLLILQPAGPGRWRLAVDEWSKGLLGGPEFDLPSGRCEIDVIVGPAIKPVAEPGPLATQLVVLSGETELARFHLTLHLDSFHTLDFGVNSSGFSTSPEFFQGQFERLSVDTADAETALRRAKSQ
jgi:hypothetical protein